ncbi:MAG TPA: phosphoribosylglycinamide synthetase C domain-containing protein, partial [Candidatus Norongarragalinales archaeon]|nr:phosphoribosylglycinamide synthetase C domain-containing protein [Candidatus Norongarragalinales archaeon]
YPDRRDTFKFVINEAALKNAGVEWFYSGVEKKHDGLWTTGSRGFAVTAKGANLGTAYQKVESALSGIDLTGFRYRKDIASGESLAMKNARMDSLRSYSPSQK